jgi:hypothetical protein
MIIIIIIIFYFTIPGNHKSRLYYGLHSSAHKLNNVAHNFNRILLSDYKFTLYKYNTNNTEFLGVEICAKGK